MSVSLSRLERGTPPPRTKSCAACIKAKRRCDRGLPQCARCTSRQLTCVYSSSKAKAPGRAAHRPSGHDSHSQSIARLHTSTDLDLLWNSGTAEAGETDGTLRVIADLNVCPALGALCTTDYPSAADWVAHDFLESSNHDPLLGIGLEDLDVTLDSPPVGHNALAPLTESEACPRLLVPPNFDVEAVTTRMEQNLSYAVDQIKNAPRRMLLETQTPWSHASLYKRVTPQTMQGERPIILHTITRSGMCLRKCFLLLLTF